MGCDVWVDMDNEIRWKCYTCGKEFDDSAKWEAFIQGQHEECRKTEDGLLAVNIVQGFKDI